MRRFRAPDRSARFITCRALRLPSPFSRLSRAFRCSSSVWAEEILRAANSCARACISTDRLPDPIMIYVRKKLAIMRFELRRQGGAWCWKIVNGRRRIESTATRGCLRIQFADQAALLAEQLTGITLLPFQTMLIGLVKTGRFSRSRKCRSMARETTQIRVRVVRILNAQIRVGVGFQAQRGHLAFSDLAQNDQRLFAASGAQCFGQCQGVELARLMPDEHGIEDFIASRARPAAKPLASSSTTSEALSAASASANQPPVRSYVVTYSMRIRGGSIPGRGMNMFFAEPLRAGGTQGILGTVCNQWQRPASAPLLAAGTVTVPPKCVNLSRRYAPDRKINYRENCLSRLYERHQR